jgi:hypothetical protein
MQMLREDKGNCHRTLSTWIAVGTLSPERSKTGGDVVVPGDGCTRWVDGERVAIVRDLWTALPWQFLLLMTSAVQATSLGLFFSSPAQDDCCAVEALIAKRKAEDAAEQWFYRPGSTEFASTDTMLLLYQSEQQRAMLKKYGQVVVGLDATYKTTMWSLPLFVVNVVDNHGHGFPVATFFMQTEQAECIAEALRL